MTPTPKPVEMHRLSAESYDKLQKVCPAIAVTNETTERQMGYQLGVQFVLKLLREGYVIG
jgi:hypothetical protein